MTLIGALNSAIDGINVTSAQIQVASQNIANAGTSGYSSETANLETLSTGGVAVSNYTRATNQALWTSLLQSNATTGMTSIQNQYLTQIDNAWGLSSTSSSSDGTPPLTSDLNQFISDWSALQAEPNSTTQQTQVISDANNLAEQLQNLSSSLGTLTTQINANIDTAVSSVNSDLTNISQLNSQIADIQAEGGDSSALVGQRQSAIEDLSQYMQISVQNENSGVVQISTTGGYLLVGAQTAQITYTGTEFQDSTGTDITSQIGGGQLQGLYNLVDTSDPTSTDPSVDVIAKLQSQLDSIANMLVSPTGSSGVQSFSDAYASGTAGTGQLASGFFTGTNATNIAVNASLLNGSKTINTASISAVYTALTASGRTDLSADGVAATSTSYAGYVGNIMTALGSAINTNSSQNTQNTTLQSALSTQLSNSTGVNTDDQLMELTTIQNAYDASTRTLQVLQTMYSDLDNIFG